MKDSSEKAFGARNKISCHFIEPFTFIFLHLLGGFGRKTPSVLLFSGLFPSVWCILGLSSFSRFSYFQDGFSFVPKFLPEICGAWTFVFLESGRSFAVPFPLFSGSVRCFPVQLSFFSCCFPCFPLQLSPFCPLAFPFFSCCFPPVTFPFLPASFPFFSCCFSFFSDFLR